MSEIYTEMTEAFKRGESFAVATVVATRGSTPRKAGAKMLFFPGGRIVGTIGGGCGEAEIWQEAMNIIGSFTPKLVTVDLTEDVESEDRICGGIMEILIEPM
ncbi:XdhC family protein [Chloroflexota bacterium]